jgi:hypothetical protein
VSIPVAIAIVGVAVLLASGAMLLVRSRAPEGGFYSSSRGIGIYASVQGSLGILIAFVIFLAFQSYLQARSSSEQEATAVLQLYRVAGLFPSPTSQQVRGGLICYARAVIGPDWSAQEDGHSSPIPSADSTAIDEVFEGPARSGAISGTAAGQWFDALNDRADAHQRRQDEVTPFVPTLLWIMLIGGAVAVLTFLLAFADPRERPLVQVLIVATPAAVIASGLVLVYFFSHPYARTSGSIEPTAMRHTLTRMQQLGRSHGEALAPPCDASGRLVRAL